MYVSCRYTQYLFFYKEIKGALEKIVVGYRLVFQILHRWNRARRDREWHDVNLTLVVRGIKERKRVRLIGARRSVRQNSIGVRIEFV